jgi:hypothetical protein
MSADVLLARLEGVKKSGNGRWMARCPAHADRSPSLSIRELEDGRILLHDFGGCETGDVLAAVGLGVTDLFPEPRIGHHSAPSRPNHYHAAREALRALADDVLLVVMGAESLAAGIALAKQDRDNLLEAGARCRRAWDMVR